jgi:broad specificity phosphatase PhoE
MALILLVRHGQASFGAADYDELSDVGEHQARIVGERLASLPRVDRVVHGAMRRQETTAALIAEGLDGQVPVVCDHRWDEYDHEALLAGALPTKADQDAFAAEMAAADDPKRAFQARFEQATARWTCGDFDADYEEPFPAFLGRVHDGLEALAEGHDRDACSVVATSGGVIAAVCAGLLGLDGTAWANLNRVIVNTSVTKLVHGRSGLTLLSVNDHAHLEGEHRRLLTYR